MVQKYVICGQAEDNIDHVNAWYRRCRLEKTPYVTVVTRRKYADVQWDYLRLPSEMDDIIRHKAERLITGFTDIFRKYASQKSEYRIGSHVTSFVNIEISKAQLLATELYEYLSQELGQRE